MPAEERPCWGHKDHGTARPLRIVGHHIVPKEWGGDPKGELYWCCDNFHYAVHRIMDWLRLQDRGPKDDGVGGLPPDEVLKMVPPFLPVHGGSRKEIWVAREGYRRWVALGRPK
jgi:hypothetical protein